MSSWGFSLNVPEHQFSITERRRFTLLSRSWICTRGHGKNSTPLYKPVAGISFSHIINNRALTRIDTTWGLCWPRMDVCNLLLGLFPCYPAGKSCFTLSTPWGNNCTECLLSRKTVAQSMEFVATVTMKQPTHPFFCQSNYITVTSQLYGLVASATPRHIYHNWASVVMAMCQPKKYLQD